jgi:hypothetical protein
VADSFVCAACHFRCTGEPEWGDTYVVDRPGCGRSRNSDAYCPACFKARHWGFTRQWVPILRVEKKRRSKVPPRTQWVLSASDTLGMLIPTDKGLYRPLLMYVSCSNSPKPEPTEIGEAARWLIEQVDRPRCICLRRYNS